MLAKPQNGWSSISLFDFQAEASYLVDIPFEWLQTCKYGIENRLPITLFIDEEGSEEYITSYYDVTHIIVDRDDEIQCLTYRKYDFMDLTADIICDIRKYFEDWVRWSPYEDEKETEGKREKRLRDLIAETELALEKEMERCHKIR